MMLRGFWRWVVGGAVALGIVGVAYVLTRKPTIYYNQPDSSAAQAIVATTGGKLAVFTPGTTPPLGSVVVGGPAAYGATGKLSGSTYSYPGAPSWFPTITIDSGLTTITGPGNSCSGLYYKASHGGRTFVFGINAVNTLSLGQSYPNCPAGS